MNQTFYICKHCGNVITMIRDCGVPVFCCGEKMEEIAPGTTDGAGEKHIPVYQVHDNQVTVSVGAVEHPMTEDHYIGWICLQTRHGTQHRKLEPGDPPHACFALCGGDTVEGVYAFCNLHSLWKG